MKLLIERAQFLNNASEKVLKAECEKFVDYYQVFINDWIENNHPSFPHYIQLKANKVTTALGFTNPEYARSSGKYNITIEYGFLLSGNDKDIKDTIVHELCHQICFWQDKPFHDGAKYFEDMLIKHGSSSSYAPVKEFLENLNIHKCKCNRIYARKMKYGNHHCRECKAKLLHIERKFTSRRLLGLEYPDKRIYIH